MNLIKVLVENQNGILVTTSNRVAEELGVRHDNLLVKIEEYLSKFNSPEVSGQFYIPSNYKASNGRMVKNYLITEKGIAQLIGGYSAAVPKAFDLNVAYINEFERMKSLIKNNMQKPMSIPEQLLMNAQWMVEAENRMSNIENNVAQTNQSIGNMKKDITRIEHNERRTVTSNHLTVIAYANMKGIKPNTYNSSVMGRKATKVCRNRGLLTGTVVDSKYGLINTYPLEVLDEIFFG
ncbi:Rha family transcriptional regulator [Leptotrichia trevisanii]|uniref:Rha family transcriptional regulator n=1 Tax=Leptotrichia trevisanii TaxID=109328 RepID=UPI0026EF353F|nr:Rha family transcriptional regulator [Leptotrichia trevisanii]